MNKLTACAFCLGGLLLPLSAALAKSKDAWLDLSDEAFAAH